MSEELKTLKDMQEKTVSQKVLKMELRSEAIKWIKEDLAFIKSGSKYITPEKIIERWKFRLNISEEELKQEVKKK